MANVASVETVMQASKVGEGIKAGNSTLILTRLNGADMEGILPIIMEMRAEREQSSEAFVARAKQREAGCLMVVAAIDNHKRLLVEQAQKEEQRKQDLARGVRFLQQALEAAFTVVQTLACRQVDGVFLNNRSEMMALARRQEKAQLLKATGDELFEAGRMPGDANFEAAVEQYAAAHRLDPDNEQITESLHKAEAKVPPSGEVVEMLAATHRLLLASVMNGQCEDGVLAAQFVPRVGQFHKKKWDAAVKRRIEARTKKNKRQKKEAKQLTGTFNDTYVRMLFTANLSHKHRSNIEKMQKKRMNRVKELPSGAAVADSAISEEAELQEIQLDEQEGGPAWRKVRAISSILH
eukprot:COSAG05_NODE_455_length_9636_cov_370.199203_4_plen_350_part_01